LRYRSGHPQTQCRAAGWHVQCPRLGYLFEQRNWLAGHHSSIADITVGAYLSVLGLTRRRGKGIPRPSCGTPGSNRARASARCSPDRVPCLKPATHYDDLDF
jgi:hypothetical protein